MNKIKEFFKNLWKKIKSNPFGFIGRVVLFVLALVILICSFLPKGNKQQSAYADTNIYGPVTHHQYFLTDKFFRYSVMVPDVLSVSYSPSHSSGYKEGDLFLMDINTISPIDEYLDTSSTVATLSFANGDFAIPCLIDTPNNLAIDFITLFPSDSSSGQRVPLEYRFAGSKTRICLFRGWVDSNFNFYTSLSHRTQYTLYISSVENPAYAIAITYIRYMGNGDTSYPQCSIYSRVYDFSTSKISDGISFTLPSLLGMPTSFYCRPFFTLVSLNDPFSAQYRNGTYSSFYYGLSSYNTGFNSDSFSAGKQEGLTEGYNNGFSAGKQEGLTEGYNNGFSAGKQEGLTEGYNNGFSAGKTEGYNQGYNEGYVDGKADNTAYDEGYTTGFNVGHTAGRNEALTEGLTNPVTFILQPVSTFLDTKLFGVVSIGQMLSVALFVMIAVVFLKMFAGG